MGEAGSATASWGPTAVAWRPPGTRPSQGPSKGRRNFVEVARKTYLKYHITAVLDLRIILESEITASSVNDIAMLPVVLGKMKR